MKKNYHLPDSLIQVLKERADQNPNNLLYTFLEDNLQRKVTRSFGEIITRAKAIASVLQTFIKPGERALMIYQPGIDYIDAFYGCLFAGVIAVPAYPPMNACFVNKLQGIIKDSKPSAIITTTKVAKQLMNLKLLKLIMNVPFMNKLGPKKIMRKQWLVKWDFNKLNIITTDNIENHEQKNWREPKISKNDIAFLQYTSGSTGQPKGVMVGHCNIIHCLDLMLNEIGLKGINCGVIWLPPYHDMGLLGGILEPAYGNFSVVLFSPFDFIKNPFNWLSTISKYRAYVTGGPNFAYELCIRRITEEQKQTLDLSCLKAVFSGAEPINHKTLEAFGDAFESAKFDKKAFYPCYGMAETTLMICGNHYDSKRSVLNLSKDELGSHRIKIVPLGAPDSQSFVSSGSVKNINIKIVNPETLQICKRDEVGEIFVSDDIVTLGYWKNTELTEYAFKNKLPNDENFYFRTGDLGYINNDRLFITGRIKDLIIVDGKKYYPQDIEATVDTAHSSTRSGRCVAVMLPGDNGESLGIICEVNCTDENQAKEVILSINNAAAELHNLAPSVIALIKPKTLYRTTSGKVERQATKQALLDNKLELISIWRSKTKFS